VICVQCTLDGTEELKRYKIQFLMFIKCSEYIHDEFHPQYETASITVSHVYTIWEEEREGRKEGKKK
jgi:hypothetical protein